MTKSSSVFALSPLTFWKKKNWTEKSEQVETLKGVKFVFSTEHSSARLASFDTFAATVANAAVPAGFVETLASTIKLFTDVIYTMTK